MSTWSHLSYSSEIDKFLIDMSYFQELNLSLKSDMSQSRENDS